MVVTVGDTDNLRQEAGANRFAIELLAPAKMVARYVKKLPGLEHVIEMSSSLDISKAAAARRYVDLHSANLAVVFSQRGRYKYSHKTTGFPWMPFKAGDMIPSTSAAEGSNPSDLVEVDSDEWFGKRKDGTLWMQVLEQENGHATTLLEFEATYAYAEDLGFDENYVVQICFETCDEIRAAMTAFRSEDGR